MSSKPAERRRARRPTMREVAAVAGVSLSTVSRVVNGGDGVRADLAVRVREAVELLGYRHNITASTLRRADRQSSSIGLIFEDVSNPFFGAVHRGVEDVARERGILTLVGSSDEEPDRERELAEAFSARGVDGLIVASAVHDSSYLLRERAAGIALVFVDRPAELRRRGRGRLRQRRRRAHGRRAPDRGRPSADRLPRRQARRLHRRGAPAGLPGDARAARPR
jgi:hypothetical protein